MRVIDRAEWREQPWKNGRGTTLEIVRRRLATDIDRRAMPSADGTQAWAFENSDDDYDVRVSLAEVTSSGPFSTFPGYRRHTFLVGPAPIRLGDVSLVAPGDHIELPGDRAIEATLSVPTQLLNVLVRSSLAITVGYGPTAHHVLCSFDVSTKIARAAETPAPIESRTSVWIG